MGNQWTRIPVSQQERHSLAPGKGLFGTSCLGTAESFSVLGITENIAQLGGRTLQCLLLFFSYTNGATAACVFWKFLTLDFGSSLLGGDDQPGSILDMQNIIGTYSNLRNLCQFLKKRMDILTS